MGWARLIILEANRKLAEVASKPAEDVEKIDLQLSDEKLENLIGDGLDSIWHE
jgi:aryl carrier-like protein